MAEDKNVKTIDATIDEETGKVVEEKKKFSPIKMWQKAPNWVKRGVRLVLIGGVAFLAYSIGKSEGLVPYQPLVDDENSDDDIDDVTDMDIM